MPNRLVHETSPYLLQHKDNPVDWYPWGPEALARAKAEDKLPSLGIQQARRDAGKHHVPFVFSKLEIAQRLGFAAQQDIEPVASRVAEVGRMLNGLIEALQIDRAGY